MKSQYNETTAAAATARAILYGRARPFIWQCQFRDQFRGQHHLCKRNCLDNDFYMGELLPRMFMVGPQKQYIPRLNIVYSHVYTYISHPRAYINMKTNNPYSDLYTSCF